MAMKEAVYLDYAAATPVVPDVHRAMEPYLLTEFANPSSLHSAGVRAEKAVKASRKTIAKLFACHEDEIIFTSGGTESINTAIRGVVGARPGTQHVVSSNIEHPATLETLAHLKKRGHDITLVPCGSNGVVKADDIIRALTPRTTLISLILVQNEIGTVQPVADVGRLLIGINRQRRERGQPQVLLHTDACQAPVCLEVRMPTLHADLASFDAAKCYGPKGSGLLIVRRDIALQPLLYGGGQQANRRSGTEAVPLIVGAAAAFSYCAKKRPKETLRLKGLSQYLIKRIKKEIPRSIICGMNAERSPHIVHVAFADVEGESIVLRLDRAGIAASTGSACSSVSGKPSHIITALRIPGRFRPGSLRLSLGYAITKADVVAAFTMLKRIVLQLQNNN